MLFNEPKLLKSLAEEFVTTQGLSFSALQRAEIAEILDFERQRKRECVVSVLFNEPKLLKFWIYARQRLRFSRFSALQRAEIAEIGALAIA